MSFSKLNPSLPNFLHLKTLNKEKCSTKWKCTLTLKYSNRKLIDLEMYFENIESKTFSINFQKLDGFEAPFILRTYPLNSNQLRKIIDDLSNYMKFKSMRDSSISNSKELKELDLVIRKQSKLFDQSSRLQEILLHSFHSCTFEGYPSYLVVESSSTYACIKGINIDGTNLIDSGTNYNPIYQFNHVNMIPEARVDHINHRLTKSKYVGDDYSVRGDKESMSFEYIVYSKPDTTIFVGWKTRNSDENNTPKFTLIKVENAVENWLINLWTKGNEKLESHYKNFQQELSKFQSALTQDVE